MSTASFRPAQIGTYGTAAILHPQEMSCFTFIFLYWLSIPAMVRRFLLVNPY